MDTDDPLQRFGYVKVEGTSFTVSEPFSTLEIKPIIYTYATEEQRTILREQFEAIPFLINTIRLERIFTDKIFVAEFYYEREMYYDVAKHIYDVGVMLDIQSIWYMLRNTAIFIEMSEYKRLEETRRTGSNLADKRFAAFRIFRGLFNSKGLREALNLLQTSGKSCKIS